MSTVVDKVKNIKQYKVEQVQRLLFCTNMINVGCMLTIAITFIMTPAAFLSFSTFLTAVYVVVFACAICGFECGMRSQKIAGYYFENCYFMFSWPGRLMFYFFLASLTWLVGSFGWVASIFSILNVLLNVYVICMHDEYKAWVEEESVKHMNKKHHAHAPVNDEETGNALDTWGNNLSDVKKKMEFVQTHKESIEKGAEFYSNNKEAVDKGLQFAKDNPEMVKKGAQIAGQQGLI